MSKSMIELLKDLEEAKQKMNEISKQSCDILDQMYSNRAEARGILRKTNEKLES